MDTSLPVAANSQIYEHTLPLHSDAGPQVYDRSAEVYADHEAVDVVESRQGLRPPEIHLEGSVESISASNIGRDKNTKSASIFMHMARRPREGGFPILTINFQASAAPFALYLRNTLRESSFRRQPYSARA